MPSAEEVRRLGEYLAERTPPRTRLPGMVRRYNDHVVALAGYLVEVVSGMPYEKYVQESVFRPLEMADTSVVLPPGQLDRVDRGYPVSGGLDDAYPLSYYHLNDAPGTSINTTAQDMARYMIAYLQDGRYAQEDGTEVRILAEESAQALHQTAFTYHPAMAGQANGSDEEFAVTSATCARTVARRACATGCCS